MSHEEAFTFINVSHPDEARGKAAQRLIRRRVMRDIGKSRRKRKDAPTMSFALQASREPQRSSSLRPALSSNPFPMDFDFRAQELMNFMIAESECNYRPFRKVWFSMALCDPSAFMLSMANAAMFFDEARNPDTFRYERSSEALRYYGQCVEQVTTRLSDPADCTSVGVITTILGLICHDLYVGTLDRWAYHIRGLARLAGLRGGFHDLSSDLQLFARWFDVMGSVAQDKQPQLVEYTQPCVVRTERSDSREGRLERVLGVLKDAPPELADISNILKQSAEIFEFVNTHFDQPGFWRTEDDLTPLQMLGPISNQLLSLSRCDYSTAGPHELVREMTRLALLILIAELKSTYGMSAHESLLLQTKFYQLLQFTETDAVLVCLPQIQLWAIFMVTLLQMPGAKRNWYVKLICLRIAALDIRDGTAAMDNARGIAWVEVVARKITVQHLISEIDIYHSNAI